MKKRGKYEKIPQAQAKVRAEKTILHTYVTSLLSLVLCVTMFFGTSFAWFTSEVTNTENEIYIGTLDVGLFKETIENGTEKTIDLSEKDTKLFDGNIRWEPGYTTLETIKIVNEGDLAFNYVLNFIETPATTEENGAATQSEETEKLDIKTVAENFDVWVCEHSGEDAPTPKSYKEITEDSKWKYVGSLKALLSGDFVLKGAMAETDVRKAGQETEAINKGTTDGLATEHTYTIALHMKEETNDPALMGYKISLNVKLIAYQMVSEQDDLGGNHDELTPVSDAEGLKAALESEATQVNIVLAEGDYIMPSFNGTKVISISGSKDAVVDVTKGAYLEGSTVTFAGVTIKGSTGYVEDANGNKGSDYAALYSPNVTYTNCTFVGPMRVGRDGAKFINCTFTDLGNDYVWTYGNDVTFEGCTFNTAGKAILIYSDGGNEVSKVSVKNCTFNSTQGATASAIANQNCAAIEIDNYGCGVNLTTSGNKFDSNFSGEWRIKSYYDGKEEIKINGVTYTTIAIDGKTMTIDGDKKVTVQG